MVVESRGVQYPKCIVVRKLLEGEASINLSVESMLRQLVALISGRSHFPPRWKLCADAKVDAPKRSRGFTLTCAFETWYAPMATI